MFDNINNHEYFTAPPAPPTGPSQHLYLSFHFFLLFLCQANMEALPNEKTSLPSLQRSNEVVSGIESDGQLEWTEEEEKALVRK